VLLELCLSLPCLRLYICVREHFYKDCAISANGEKIGEGQCSVDTYALGKDLKSNGAEEVDPLIPSGLVGFTL